MSAIKILNKKWRFLFKILKLVLRGSSHSKLNRYSFNALVETLQLLYETFFSNIYNN